jgi:hypothetical protein
MSRRVEAGAPGREFYIVADGCVEIRRRDGTTVVLGVGDGFGEEAILGDGRRNASAHALESTTLMRLDEAPFRSLLVPALVRWIPNDAILPHAVVIDLDGQAAASDPQACLARLSRSAPVVIAGATRAATSWAFSPRGRTGGCHSSADRKIAQGRRQSFAQARRL